MISNKHNKVIYYLFKKMCKAYRWHSTRATVQPREITTLEKHGLKRLWMEVRSLTPGFSNFHESYTVMFFFC